MRWLLLLLALGGVYVSARAWQIHYSTDTPPCSINEKWDCGVVNHSEFAVMHFHGHEIPVAGFGIVGYCLLGVLALARRRMAFVIAAALGLAFALHLTWIEKTVLQTWCLFCVISQSIILLMFVLGTVWWLLGRRRA
jgi:vitamin-K-epoxide reductase (warfarin-sensitive)